MTEIVLDEKGNINQTVLEKSLKSALDFDIKYKQRDNMKKRACKTAASYDEFKAMVDCAHLKKLSRQEIESLGDKKQGWSKSSGSNKAEKASILREEMVGEEIALAKVTADLKKLSTGKTKTPKTPLELSRDLRRLSSDTERIEYLKAIGLKTVKTLMKHETDAELFETILNALVRSIPGYRAHCAAKCDAESSVEASPASELATVICDLPKWLQRIAEIETFGLLVRFVSIDLTSPVVELLRSCEGEAVAAAAERYRTQT